MKTLITIATLLAATSASANYNSNAYDWNNDAVTPVIKTTNVVAKPTIYKLPTLTYVHQDNGIFGYNPYNVMDPRWMIEEMSNIIE